MGRKFAHLIVLVTVALSGKAFSCSCLPFNLADSFNASDSVFIAQLTAAQLVTPADSNAWPYIEGTFNVTDVFKGKPGKTLKLRTGLGGGDCGIPMAIARRYVLFKSTNDYIGICDGSTALHAHEEDELAEKLRRLRESLITLGNLASEAKFLR